MSRELVEEMKQEAAATRRMLERVPDDKLEWRPHPRSMTLGQLALHIAMIPTVISNMAQLEEFDAGTANFTPPQPATTGQILDTLEQSLTTAGAYLAQLPEEAARASWRMTLNGRELVTLPRRYVLRSILFNHWYHHRGQLSVYLRLLDVPVPVVYGRSADENPFG